jgi:hypothetical protein
VPATDNLVERLWEALFHLRRDWRVSCFGDDWGHTRYSVVPVTTSGLYFPYATFEEALVTALEEAVQANHEPEAKGG